MSGHPMVLNGKYAEVIFRDYVESAQELPPEAASTIEDLQP
ncbi:MAG: hypothetical protein AAF378_09820 [Cyanobacteria bacterium P01_A01_bin.84]